MGLSRDCPGRPGPCRGRCFTKDWSMMARSPGGAQRNPGQIFHNAGLTTGYAALHPGNGCERKNHDMRPKISAPVSLALALIATMAAPAPASAQTYPARPVTIITPFAAGSVTDATARAIAQHLQDALGQPFVMENRAG